MAADAAPVLVVLVVVVVVVFNELDDWERGVGGLGVVEIVGFLPKPKRRASQEVVVVGDTEGSEGVVVEEGDDDAAVVDVVVGAVADVDRIFLLIAAVGDSVAKAPLVESSRATRSSSSSLQMEGERVFLGLSSD